MTNIGRYFFRSILLICCAFILQINTALAADYFIMPEIVGLSKKEAIDKLNAACGNIAVTLYTNKIHDETMPNGSVRTQKPAAGTKIYSGTKLNITIAENNLNLSPTPTPIDNTKDYTGTFIMPELAGLTRQQAIDKINAACGNIPVFLHTSKEPTDKVLNDIVIGVEPAPGSTIKSGTMLVLNVAENDLTPETMKSYPDVIGMKREKAKETLINAGFSQFKIFVKYNNNQYLNAEEDTVIRSLLNSKGQITLTVHKKIMVTMPNLKGKTYAEAEQIAKDMNIFKQIKREEVIYSVEFLQQNPSRASELHKVVGQTPKPGALINPDAYNVVWIDEGIPEVEKTVTVPNIGQMKEADAIASLKYRGLIPSITYEKTTSEFLGGTASVKTDPKQGSKVKGGTTVKFTVYQYKPKVPFLKGYTPKEAQKKLTALGLKSKIEYKSTLTEALDGQIADYSPKAQTQVEPGSTVTITVYKNDQIRIPNLVRMKKQEAIDYLKKHKSKLNYKIEYEDTVYTTRDGQVAKTIPEYKTIVKPGDTLTVYVYRMLQSVPNVIGKAESNAIYTLKKAGFKVLTRYELTSNPGTIIKQSQTAGSPATGSVISLTVAKAPDNVRLPNVVGKSQQDAINTITSTEKFTYKIQRMKVYESSQEGKVTHMYPAGNTMVPPDTQVTIYVGKYVGTVPNVVGMSENDAKNKLSQAGFAGIVSYINQGTPGKVMNQKPDAGAEPTSGVQGNFVKIYVTMSQANNNTYYDPMQEEYVIPYVKTLDVREARIRLAENNINYVIDELPVSPDRHGKVLGSYPPRGVKVRPDQIVVLKVGKSWNCVPNVIGMTLDRATNYIEKSRLEARIVNPKNLNDKNKGTAIVIEQDPYPGTYKKGPYVNITIAKEATIPDLINKPFVEAISLLRQNSLKYDVEHVTVMDGSKNGLILDMEPGARQKVAFGTKVKIKVGRILDIVPNVIGKSENEAEKTLKDLAFAVQKEYIGSNRSNSIVIGQSQSPGAKRGPCNITIVLGTQNEMSSITTPTPAIRPNVRASVQMAPQKALSQGAPPLHQVIAITADETNAINAVYTKLKQAYQYKDEYQIVDLLSDNWESSDGSTVMDVEDNLRNKFTLFDDIQCNISGLSISKFAGNTYRANYDIEIIGKMYEAGITRKEKSSVSEELIFENNKYKIRRTLSGQFWYRE